MVYTTEIYFPQIWRLEGSRSRCRQGRFLSEVSSLGCRGLPPDCVLTWPFLCTYASLLSLPLLLLFFRKCLFLYFWLCWLLVSVWAFSSCRQARASHCRDFSLCRAWALGNVGSVVAAAGLSCPMPCGIFLEQEWNMCPLHCKADSQPLDHQGSPLPLLIRTLIMLD